MPLITLFEAELTLSEKLVGSSVNLSICGICLITKIYQIKRYRTKLNKLTLFGLFSMGAALLFCTMTVAGVLLRYHRITTYPTCKIVYVSSRALYALQRAFLFAFVVWRAEIVNVCGSIPEVLFRVAKCIVFTSGLFIVGGMILFVETPDSQKLCKMHVNDEVLVVGWAVDVFICVAASWLFLHSLSRILKSEDMVKRDTVKKEAYCITISLLSTLATAVLNNLIDGIMETTIELDCSITTICLLLLSTPVKLSDPNIYVQFSSANGAKSENETTPPGVQSIELHNVKHYSRALGGRTASSVSEFREMGTMRLNQELDDLFRTSSFDANSDMLRSRTTQQNNVGLEKQISASIDEERISVLV